MAGWVDQAVVSAMGLLMLLALARWADISDVGYFAIAASILAFAVAVQDSLVTRPYTILLVKPDHVAEMRTADAVVFSAVMAMGLSVLALLVGVMMHFYSGSKDATSITLALSVAIPAVLFREFARRHSFAHHMAWRAVAVDASAACVAGVGIGCLWSIQAVSATNAVLILGLAGFVAVGVWLALLRQSFAVSLDSLLRTACESIKLGQWFLVGQLSAQAQGYATHWITMAVGGVAATGLYTSCLSIVALSNPFLFGYFNILTPKFVLVLKEEGADALRRQVNLSTILLALVMAAFACFVWLNGSMLLGAMFPGDVYREGLGILSILALSTLVGAVGGPPSVALMVAEKGHALAVWSLSILFAGSALIGVLMVVWGLQAAVYGILMMETVNCLGRWSLMYHLLPRALAPENSSTPLADAWR